VKKVVDGVEIVIGKEDKPSKRKEYRKETIQTKFKET